MESWTNSTIGTAAKAAPPRLANFGLTTCSLDISLNNRYQESDYLAGIVNWVSKRFESCIVNFGDTLHRYNLALGTANMGEAHVSSKKMGDEWLARNSEILKGFTIPYKIIRNDDWLNDKSFPEIHEALWSYYYTDYSYRKTVISDIEGYLNRQPERARELSKQSGISYLLEETSADILMARVYPAVHIYPGSWHQSYVYLMKKQESLPDILRGLEKCVFKRISPSKVLSSRQREAKMA